MGKSRHAALQLAAIGRTEARRETDNRFQHISRAHWIVENCLATEFLMSR